MGGGGGAEERGSGAGVVAAQPRPTPTFPITKPLWSCPVPLLPPQLLTKSRQGSKGLLHVQGQKPISKQLEPKQTSLAPFSSPSLGLWSQGSRVELACLGPSWKEDLQLLASVLSALPPPLCGAGIGSQVSPSQTHRSLGLLHWPQALESVGSQEKTRMREVPGRGPPAVKGVSLYPFSSQLEVGAL